MTSVPTPTPTPSHGSPPVASASAERGAGPRGFDRTLWIVAADCGIAALATALSLRGDQRLVVVMALAVIAAALVAVIAGRALAAAARSGALVRVVTALVVSAVAVALLAVSRTTVGWRPVLLATAAFLGLALVLRWLVIAIEASDAESSAPWSALAGGGGGGGPGGRVVADRVGRQARIGAGFGAVLLAGTAVGTIRFAMMATNGGPPARGLTAGVVIVAVLTALVAGPLALVSQARLRRARADRERGRQRQAVAAHLHDSVLQTLALIQRSAGDEQRVLHLARQQERGLRAWLAGQDDPPESSLAAALRAVAVSVEDEAGGRASIEVIVVGDAPLDPAADALVQAAREALRNAARHAGGVVRVVVDPDPESGELVVFVRDTGAGFDPGSVAAERRGIRDAIIGRMEHAGGSAAFETGSDGTEVVLRLPSAAGSGR